MVFLDYDIKVTERLLSLSLVQSLEQVNKILHESPHIFSWFGGTKEMRKPIIASGQVISTKSPFIEDVYININTACSSILFRILHTGP